MRNVVRVKRSPRTPNSEAQDPVYIPLPQAGDTDRPVQRTRTDRGQSATGGRALTAGRGARSGRTPKARTALRKAGGKPLQQRALNTAPPTRTCVGCGMKATSAELLRAVPLSDVESDAEQAGIGVAFDLTGKESGRGAWVHPRTACLEKACARGFARSFKRPVVAKVEALLEHLKQAATRRLGGLILAASRARHLVCGRDAVKEALPKAALIVMATDARAVAKDAALQRAGLDGKVVCWSTKAELGHLLGRAEVGVFAVTEHALAEAMRRVMALSCLGQDSVQPHPSLTVASVKELSEVR